MTGFIEPVTLTGQRWVMLEPLTRDHVPEIATASADGDVGSLWFTGAPSPQTASQWVDTRLSMQTPDTGLTFVVRRLDGTVVGSSSYLNVDPPNRRLEIGNTWYGASARRSGINSETKLLMLGHAFDVLRLRGGRIPHTLLQLRQPHGDRAARRETRRGAAQSSVGARRDATRHRGVFDPGCRMANRA